MPEIHERKLSKDVSATQRQEIDISPRALADDIGRSLSDDIEFRFILKFAVNDLVGR